MYVCMKKCICMYVVKEKMYVCMYINMYLCMKK